MRRRGGRGRRRGRREMGRFARGEARGERPGSMTQVEVRGEFPALHGKGPGIVSGLTHVRQHAALSQG